MLLLWVLFFFFLALFSLVWVIVYNFKRSPYKNKKLSLFFSFLDHIDFRLVSAKVMTKNKGKVLKKKKKWYKLSHFSQTSYRESGMYFPTLKMYKIKLKTTQISHHAFTLVEKKLYFLPKKHSFKFRTQQ